jgi:hypothetical protein
LLVIKARRSATQLCRILAVALRTGHVLSTWRSSRFCPLCYRHWSVFDPALPIREYEPGHRLAQGARRFRARSSCSSRRRCDASAAGRTRVSVLWTRRRARVPRRARLGTGSAYGPTPARSHPIAPELLLRAGGLSFCLCGGRHGRRGGIHSDTTSQNNGAPVVCWGANMTELPAIMGGAISATSAKTLKISPASVIIVSDRKLTLWLPS